MTTTAQTTAPPRARQASSTTGSAGYRYRWMVLAVVLIADVMDLLDATIANLAGPSIRADLGGSARRCSGCSRRTPCPSPSA